MEDSTFTLAGKTILITGGSSGIGAASAQECARAGARVIVTGRRSDALAGVLASLTGKGHAAISADLSHLDDVSRLAGEIPPLDGFVHSAGITRTQLVRFADEATTRELLEVNLISVIRLTQALVKQRKINRGGSMVYLSSNLGLVSQPGISVYGATKAAVAAFVRGLAVEMASRQVRANTISPGLVETPMTVAIVNGDPAAVKADQAKYLLGYGKPQDIAGAVRYFLSDASRWVTGTDFVIDGGFSIYR